MKLAEKTIKDRLKTNLGLDMKTSKILVVGVGVTGLSIAQFLAGLGFDFMVADSRKQPPGFEHWERVIANKKVILGDFDSKSFLTATHLFVSPGVSLKEKPIADAIAKGVYVYGDIDLFTCSIDAPVIAITGSNGKSTVTTMVGEMVQASGKIAGVGGNLGVPALDLLEQPAEIYVLELSSFQLERTQNLNAFAATVLNVSADHLDRHTDLADYAKQKQRVYQGDGVVVINIDDPVVSAMQIAGRQQLTFSVQQKADFWISKKEGVLYITHADNRLMAVSELPLEGKHNVANALAALALGSALGLDSRDMCFALSVFKGLAHRMQRVAEIQGVVWVNDSKATNIGACVAALQGYERKVVLIAGGDAKGADMRELKSVVQEKVKSVVLMGKDADLIEIALNGCVPVYKAENMQKAVNIAAKIATQGDCVLLSPACASLDQYKNYQERGDKFTEAVLRLAA